MDSVLDSLTWDEGLSPERQARRSRMAWLRRALLVLAAVFVLVVVLSP